MGLRDLDLLCSYDSSIVNVLDSFYLPTLSETVAYDRIAGYFSSSSLAIAAKGIMKLIHNRGKMRLLTSPLLNEADIRTINALHSDDRSAGLSSILIKGISDLEDVFKHGYWALAWMLANGFLEIKVVILKDSTGKILGSEETERSGLFHQKIGIMYDGSDDWIAFSGSINETASAWRTNVEDFCVFRSWEEQELKYADQYNRRFNRLWQGNVDSVEVLDLPQMVGDFWVKKAELECDEIDLIFPNRDDLESEKFSLYKIQEEAVRNWVESDYMGIIEMATGTGKTRTAIGCIKEFLKGHSSQVIIVISTPQNTISRQWGKELKWIDELNPSVVYADSTNKHWREDIKDLALDIELEMVPIGVIITSHNTLCSNAFKESLTELNRKSTMLLIGDEVHALGSEVRRQGLIDEYSARLGLSATPDRLYDETGTQRIRDFFGDTVYKFDIGQAQITINETTGYTYLVDYEYNPVLIELSKDELDEYYSETLKLVKQIGDKSDTLEQEDFIERILFRRAAVLKHAKNKLGALSEIINTLQNNEKTNIIVFTSPEQKNDVINILNTNGIYAHAYTEDESESCSKKNGWISERQSLIDALSKRTIHALVAIKCLDEGIDIPSARIAVIMSSSTNPREYIQRIGRVVRRNPGKDFARIFDMIIKPSYSSGYEELDRLEDAIFKKEKQRAMYILQYARNAATAIKIIGGGSL